MASSELVYGLIEADKVPHWRTIRDVMTDAERARVGASSSLSDDDTGVIYTVESPARLLSESVAANIVTHGHALLSAVPLDDGYVRCTYRLGLPPRHPELNDRVLASAVAAGARKNERRG